MSPKNKYSITGTRSIYDLKTSLKIIRHSPSAAIKKKQTKRHF